MEALFAALVLACVALLGMLMWTGLRSSSSPEKRQRWRRLPVRFKLGCFGVVSLFGSGVAAPFLLSSPLGDGVGFVTWLFALAGMLTLEIRAIAWYKRQGLLPTYNHADSP